MASVYRLVTIGGLVALSLGLGYALYERGEVRELAIAAGPADGEGFRVAEAIAAVIRTHDPTLQIHVLETRGSVENMALIGEGRVELAAVQAHTPARPRARLVADLYPDAFHLIARPATGIHGVTDLRGRRIALPPVGSGQHDAFWQLAGHYGLTAADFEARPMSNDAADFAMLTGAVDATFRVRTPGNRAIRELIEGSGAYLVPIDQAEAIRLERPELEAGVIPKGTYRGEPPVPAGELPTGVVQGLLIADREVGVDIVARITRTLFERRRDLVEITPVAGFISAAPSAAGTFLPLHPGARRYYDREKPSFLQENAESLAVALSMLVLLGSGVVRLISQRRKRRLDRYNHQVLRLYTDVRTASDREALLAKKAELMQVLGRVVDDAEEGRITAEGFHIFSFTWNAVHQATRDRLGQE